MDLMNNYRASFLVSEKRVREISMTWINENSADFRLALISSIVSSDYINEKQVYYFIKTTGVKKINTESDMHKIFNKYRKSTPEEIRIKYDHKFECFPQDVLNIIMDFFIKICARNELIVKPPFDDIFNCKKTTTSA